MLKKIKNLIIGIWRNKITILLSFLLFIIGVCIAPSKDFDRNVFYDKFNEYNTNLKLLKDKEKQFDDLNTEIETLKSNVNDISKDIEERKSKIQSNELIKLNENKADN